MDQFEHQIWQSCYDDSWKGVIAEDADFPEASGTNKIGVSEAGTSDTPHNPCCTGARAMFDHATARTDFRPVVGYEGRYEISSDGQIRTLIGIGCRRAGSILECASNRKGYRRVCLRAGGQSRTSVIHRLVLEAFVGPAPSPQHQCNHKNGVKSDNRVENLEWVTQRENIRHAADTGLWSPHVGESHGRALVTEDDVRAIRSLEGVIPAKVLGRCYGVHAASVRAIWRRRNWKHV